MSPNLEAFSKLGGLGTGEAEEEKDFIISGVCLHSFFYQQAQFSGIELFSHLKYYQGQPLASGWVPSSNRYWVRHQSSHYTLTALHGYMERVFNKFWGESITHFFNVIHLLFQLISWPAINHHFSLMVVVSSVHNTIHHPMRELPWRHPIWHMVELL